MASERIVTDEAMEFLQSEALKAHAVDDTLSYTAKDGTVFTFRVNAVYGSDDPELNDGFHAFGGVLLDENGNDTDQVVFATRCTSGYPDAYANFDKNSLGWPIFIEHKDDVLAWYNEQKNAGKSVSFTGLSLGGALTQLFAGYVHQKTGDTLNSVVTFSVPGISAPVITYEGETYDFTGKIAETVHHYMDYGDLLGQVGNYYLEGTLYIYACNYWVDQAGRSGNVIRLKDYLLQPHGNVRYLLSDDYSSNPATVFVTEMDSSDMTGSWNPLSAVIESIPEGIENTNNAVVTVGNKTYLFNKAYAEIVLSMTVSFVNPNSVDIEAASNYIPRSAWEAMRGTETGWQDFFARTILMDWTSDVKVAVNGTFSEGGKDYAVLTLTGQTQQGREFLYNFSDGKFVETDTVVPDGNWQAIAGAEVYEVQFFELAETAGTQQPETIAKEQNKTYSTTVTNELIEELQYSAIGDHTVGDTFEYTTKEGATYRLKYTEFYGSDDPELDDGFHAAGVVLLDTDGTTETDEHFLIFRGTSGHPDAFADFYEGAAGLPIFAEHTADVLEWYEKYEGQNITFSGPSLGCMLSQYFAGWLVNDKGKAPLTRLVGFLSPAIEKEAEYDDVTYHFITDKAVAETVDYYRQEGDILAAFGKDYQKGTVHLYAGNAEINQAEGVRLHEYIIYAHIGEYLTANSSLTHLADFDTDYFAEDKNYSELAVEVDAVPDGLENTNIEAVTVGDRIYLFNAEYADVALTFTNFTLQGESTASDFALRNTWEACRGSEKQELMTWLMMYNNKSDIQITTGRAFELGGKDYVQLSDEGAAAHEDFFFNFTDKEFESGYALTSVSSLGNPGGATFTIGGSETTVALAGETVTVSAVKVAGYYCTGFTSEEVTLAGNTFAMPESDVTVTAHYANASSEYNASGKSDIVQIADHQVYVLRDSEAGYAQTESLYNMSGWEVLETRRDFNGDGLADLQIAGAGEKANHTVVATLRNDFDASGIKLDYQLLRAYDNELWEYVGAADVNGDGKDETLLLQTAAGSVNGDHHVLAWTTDDTGAYQTDQDVWVGCFHIGWSIAGTADVDGNGTDNVILRRADGQICYWSETGSDELVRVWYADGSDFLTAGNFGNSGKDGILWNNAAGDYFLWNDVNDKLVDIKLGNVSELGGSWSFAGAGDYNADGKDEILWCDGKSIAYSEANKENFKNLTVIA